MFFTIILGLLFLLLGLFFQNLSTNFFMFCFIDFLNLDPVRVFTSHWIQDCKHVMPDDYEFVDSDEENRPDIFTSLKDDYKNHEEAYFSLLHAYRDVRKGYEHLPFELTLHIFLHKIHLFSSLLHILQLLTELHCS